MLCVTGAEALYADMGHFNVLSIRVRLCWLASSWGARERACAGGPLAGEGVLGGLLVACQC